jgi:hypothetical protein
MFSFNRLSEVENATTSLLQSNLPDVPLGVTLIPTDPPNSALFALLSNTK